VRTTRYFNKNVNIFETDAGVLILPMPEEVETGPLVNPRVQRVKEIGRFVTKDEVLKFFEAETKPVTRNAFVKRFGSRSSRAASPSPTCSRSCLRARASATQARSPSTWPSGEGLALRTSGVEDEALAATFRLQPGQTLKEAPVDRFETVPRDAKAALTQAGVSTIGELAEADAQELAARLRKDGIDVSTADVGGWVAVAKALGQVM
jgi:hypothetical protein